MGKNSNIPEKINGNFKGKDILDANQFSKKDLEIIFKTALKMKKFSLQNSGTNILKGHIMSAIFFEPSSRTFGSFVAGMQRLGGGIIPLQGMGQSSVSKGETLEDSIKTFSAYSDIIVMRHSDLGSMIRAANAAEIPIINAGEGVGEHPTQALYDMFTILEELGKTDNLHVVFFGELGHYRPVNSLAKLLALYPKVKMSFVSPKEGKLGNTTRIFLKEKNADFSELENIDSVIKTADVLYVTRVKKEFMTEELYNKIKGKYVVNKKLVTKMKKKSIIMHALPRVDELSTDIDNDKRSVYLKSQVKNGMYVRMALLALVLGKA